jgi:hypothetical protein
LTGASLLGTDQTNSIPSLLHLLYLL